MYYGAMNKSPGNLTKIPLIIRLLSLESLSTLIFYLLIYLNLI